MDCDRAELLIMEHSEERLAPLDASLLHNHLTGCLRCSELFLAMLSVSNAPTPDEIECVAPDNFVSSVMAKINDLPSRSVIPEYSIARAKKYLRRAACLYSLAVSVIFVLFNRGELTGIGIISQAAQTINIPASAFVERLAGLGLIIVAALHDFAALYSYAVLIIIAVLAFLMALMLKKERESEKS